MRHANRVVFAVFVALVCLLGGASRHDVMSLILLRPLAVIAFGYGLMSLPRAPLERARIPAILLIALALLILAQLLPLPPSVWHALPGRDPIMRLDVAFGLAGNWRPLALVPSRAWNSLFSLAVPAAAFVLYSRLDSGLREKLPWLFVIIGAVTMLWGMVQLVGGEDSIFYTYRIHTDNRPIGMFANRNHQAIFIAVTMLMAGVLIEKAVREGRQRLGLVIAILGGYLVLCIAFEFILGSRGGLLVAVVALAAIMAAVLASPFFRSGRKSGRDRIPSWTSYFRNRWVVGGMAGLGVSALVILAAAANRNEAFARLWVSGDNTRYDRLAVLPYLVRILRDQFPWGSGFGSFDALFLTYEPRELLTTFYLNQAHNDWMQVLIEGGIGAAAILGAFLVWLLVQLIRVRKDGGAVLLVVAIGCFGLSSLFDYPLRVPIIMMSVAFLVRMLADRDPPGETVVGSGGGG